MSPIRLYTFSRREVERFLRVPVQSLVSPWISGSLFIYIFGFVIGGHITFLDGISYIDFVFPGIVMMNIISASFGQSAFSLYFQRFSKSIDEILTSPLSYSEMITGYILGSVLRSVAVAAGLFALAIIFTSTAINNYFLFIFRSWAL